MSASADVTMVGEHQRVVRLDGDPLVVATELVAGTSLHPRLLYERDGQFRIGLGSRVELLAGPRTVRLRHGADTEIVAVQDDPLATVAMLLDRLTIPCWSAFGWASFELAYAMAGLPVADGQPLIHIVVPEVEVWVRPGSATVYAVNAELLAEAEALLQRPVTDRIREPASVTVDEPDPHYTSAVANCIAAIRGEGLEKVILSREVVVSGPVDLLGSYVHGRRHNTPARSFVVDTPELQAVGFSPEIVLAVGADGVVRTQPLAGTRAHTGDPIADRRLRHELTTDAKEIYEHAVSVRHACQEMDRICLPNSVAVREFMKVKQRGRVQHLGSEVIGTLPPVDSHDTVVARSWRAFAALFPAVTASGIPKLAAYQAIRAHESAPRGLYAGAVFTTNHTGEIDAALALRTVFRVGDRTWLRAGAGIVGQSLPEREFTETCEKLHSIATYLVRP